jgi:FKBP-type peptidyl-prolyl cis-trans isomerase FkpA
VASGIEVQDVAVGDGPAAERGRLVSIRWRGTLNRGDPFGEGEISFRAGGREVVAGLSRGVIGMRVGGMRRLRVSPHLGYRDRSVPGVPPDAVLTFEVELLGVSPEG